MTVQDSGWYTNFRRILNDKALITIGIHSADGARATAGPSNAEVGYFNEYTEPQRSFLRSTFDEKEESWQNLMKKLYRAALLGKLQITQVAELTGQRAASDVKRKVESNVPPALSPRTVARKKSSSTLIDTGQMKNAIDYEVSR